MNRYAEHKELKEIERQLFLYAFGFVPFSSCKGVIRSESKGYDVCAVMVEHGGIIFLYFEKKNAISFLCVCVSEMGLG